jgi:hypothetical protein
MNDYDGDINQAAIKTEKMLDILLPENLYSFEYCVGVMGDINGNFTWERYQKHNYLPNAAVMSHIYDMSVRNPRISDEEFLSKSRKKTGTAKYINAVSLIASQSPEAFSADRVEYYRQQIRNGKRFGCVALEIKHISNYALIIDGHHRVLASMLEGVFPECLLIAEAPYRLMVKGGQTFLKLPPNISDNVRKTGIPDLPEEVFDFLRYNLENRRQESRTGKLELYKYYRNDADSYSFDFPIVYRETAKKMIDRIFEKD